MNSHKDTLTIPASILAMVPAAVREDAEILETLGYLKVDRGTGDGEV